MCVVWHDVTSRHGACFFCFVLCVWESVVLCEWGVIVVV